MKLDEMRVLSPTKIFNADDIFTVNKGNQIVQKIYSSKSSPLSFAKAILYCNLLVKPTEVVFYFNRITSSDLLTTSGLNETRSMYCITDLKKFIFLSVIDCKTCELHLRLHHHITYATRPHYIWDTTTLHLRLQRMTWTL